MSAGGNVITQRGARWALFQVFKIPDAGQPERTYLKRLRIIQTPWFAIYLHWIYLPDKDRDPHDHPWSFASIVLRGGYDETVHYAPEVHLDYTKHRTHRRFSAHITDTRVAHQITNLEPETVTLLFVGRRRRQWGFWTGDGWVPWHEYDRAGNGPDPFAGEAVTND